MLRNLRYRRSPYLVMLVTVMTVSVGIGNAIAQREDGDWDYVCEDRDRICIAVVNAPNGAMLIVQAFSDSGNPALRVVAPSASSLDGILYFKFDEGPEVSILPGMHFYPDGNQAILSDAGQNSQLVSRIRTGKSLEVLVKRRGISKTSIARFSLNNASATIDRLGLRNTAKDDELSIAVKNGDVDEVFRLLESGADPNYDETHFTLLHYAIESGDLAIARVLLQSGADPNAIGVLYHTPLVQAASTDQAKMAMLLLQSGARVDTSDNSGNTALHRAAEAGRTRLIALLLNHGAEIDGRNQDGRSPLFLAVQNRRIESACDLIGRDADTRIVDNFGVSIRELVSALRIDAIAGRRKSSQAIQTRVRDARLSAYPANYPRAYALATLGDLTGLRQIAPTKTEALVRRGAGDTLLHVAAGRGHIDIVRYLLNLEMDPNIRALRDDRRTPLHEASIEGHAVVIRRLVDAGAEIDVRANDSGWTALHYAMKNNRVEAIAELLELGADPTVQDKRGRSAVDMVRPENRQSAVKVLNQPGQHLRKQASGPRCTLD